MHVILRHGASELNALEGAFWFAGTCPGWNESYPYIRESVAPNTETTAVEFRNEKFLDNGFFHDAAM